MQRKIDNWVDGFMEYTSALPTPELFRKWCAISAIAGALERKVWVHTLGQNLYPTLYVILVAPPGVGKSVVTSRVAKLWGALPDQHLASTSVTKASLVDDLRDATREIIRPSSTPPSDKFNSLKILSNELGVLIPSYENEFMNVLTDIYDGYGYSERRRSKDLNFELKAPQISLLAGTTPNYLSNILPEGAWEQGFLSRTMLIYSGVTVLVDPFMKATDDEKLKKNLQTDLNNIANLYGEMKFTEDAKAALTDWHLAGGPPAPDHPKLINYKTRRTLHLLKLCMVACASDSNKLEISIDHYQQALDWLIEAEHYIPDIFKSMATGGDMKAMEDTWYFIYKMYVKDKEPIPEARVFRFLQERVPAHSVENIMHVMVKSGVLKEKQVNKVGRCFIPMERGD